MTSNSSRTIIAQVDSFPALPATVSRIMDITADPESSAQDLMNAILPDQSICVTLLKIANSAFFGLPRQVSSIDKAVMVLGFDEIRNIVLGKAVFNSFHDLYRNNKQVIDHFWYHSFICGLAAKLLSEEHTVSPSEGFIAGLIHDIGKLAMLMSLNSDYAHVLEETEPLEFRTLLKEQELYAISHDDVGYRLLKRWLFPIELVNAIGYHHRPQECPDSKLLPSIIQIADMLSIFHCSEDAVSMQEITRIVDDFFPETRALWRECGLECNEENLQRWSEELTISAQRDNGILSIISS
ncbi:MAG: HDOD domain-containing protein [Desulfobulbaceae bacterium]|nr:MAG: HDOD domain-containing protein [Desulfobulbaceae bacterium]